MGSSRCKGILASELPHLLCAARPKILGCCSQRCKIRLAVMQEAKESATSDVQDTSSEQELELSTLEKTVTKDVAEGPQSTEDVSEAGIDLESYIAPALTAGTIIGIIVLGSIFKEDIKGYLEAFVTQVEGMGPSGLAAYSAVYIFLETLAVPATPLTLTAGYLFGQTQGTIVVSFSATIAALLAFLIARYAARDKVAEMAADNKKFAAIDKAVQKDGFKFVLLLRLSPLLPFAASNYLYGLTSVETRPYVLASWLGMLPGTWAYVSAGSVGRNIMDGGSASFSPVEIVLGVGVTIAALWFVGSTAKKALDEIEEEEPSDA